MSCYVQVCVIPFVFWHALKMVDLKEQHICIRFCFELGQNAMEIFEMLKIAFG